MSKKIREQLNVTKVRSHLILVLSNVMMKLSNVRKKIKVKLNVAKVQLYMILILPNMTFEPSNVRRKKKGNHQT